MANEIESSFSFRLTKGSHVENIEVSQFRTDQTGVGAHKPIYDIGTVEEVVSFGDVATPKFLIARNLDGTNFVTLGPEAAGAMVPAIVLQPGEWCFIPLDPAAVLRAQADTATCKVLFLITEE